MNCKQAIGGCAVLLLSASWSNVCGDDLIVPVSSSGNLLTALGTTTLAGSGSTSLDYSVQNNGPATATFSVVIEDDPDPAFTAVVQSTDVSIDSGERIAPAFEMRFDRTAPSGLHTYTTTVTSSGDDDNQVVFSIDHFERGQLLATPQPVDAGVNNGLFAIENPPAGPHPGAQRADVEIINSSITDGFSVGNLNIPTTIAAGNSIQANLSFEGRGRLAGPTLGTLQLFNRNLKPSTTQNLGFNGPASIQLAANVPAIASDTVSVLAGQEFAELDLGISSTDTAVVLVGGTSSSDQQIDLSFVPNPAAGDPTQPDILTEVFDIDFSFDGDLYVPQVTYNPDVLPDNFNEIDLRLLVFNENTSNWVRAISLNSDGGEGGSFFLGSFDSYLQSVGGAPMLSDFGVDVLHNKMWAVVDHNTAFAGADAGLEADFDKDGEVTGYDFRILQENLGIMTGASRCDGDADGDGDVDVDDQKIWEAQYGTTAEEFEDDDLHVVARSAPEPSAVALAFIAWVALSGTQRRAARKTV